MTEPLEFLLPSKECNLNPRPYGRQMDKYNVPRLAFINKMDRMGSDFLNAVQTMRDKLGANAHPLYLAIGAEDQFNGLIDLVQDESLRIRSKR